MRIFLIGFSGSGKSTIGPALATRLGFQFVDTDDRIARKEAMPIRDIFAKKGEDYFRKLESNIIKNVIESASDKVVVGLGGGAFVSDENRNRIANNGKVIYLSCPPEILYQRLESADDRPLLNVSPEDGQSLEEARMARLTQMLEEREPYYKQADITVSVSEMTPDEVVEEIVKRVRD